MWDIQDTLGWPSLPPQCPSVGEDAHCGDKSYSWEPPTPFPRGAGHGGGTTEHSDQEVWTKGSGEC